VVTAPGVARERAPGWAPVVARPGELLPAGVPGGRGGHAGEQVGGAPAGSRRGPAWWRRELAELSVLVLAGTGVAAAADGLVGRLDGGPPAYLLLALALPFWDLLPRRLPARFGAVALLVLGIAAVWLGVGMLRPEPWWRAEVAFGIGCAVVGTGQVLLLAVLGRRRTVDR
jgi:hypothetical protein